MRIGNATRGLDDVSLREAADHLIGTEIAGEQFCGIDPYHILAIFPADHFDPIDAGNAMQARHDIVKCDVGEFAQRTDF